MTLGRLTPRGIAFAVRNGSKVHAWLSARIGKTVRFGDQSGTLRLSHAGHEKTWFELEG